MHEEGIYIVSAKRTPLGAFLGALSGLSAPSLGAVSIRSALETSGIDPGLVDELFFGNVLSAGIGQAPARQACLGAGLPQQVACTTVNKVCGSGLQAVILAAQALKLGEAQICIAGGMESMSQVPHYLPSSRTGQRLGDARLIDGLIHDGLWDPYNDFHMGQAGELCASKYAFSRQAQDDFATESYRRARHAQESGSFQPEIVPVSLPQKRGPDLICEEDEEPARGAPEKFSQLKPAFDKAGTITAANASSLNDGAAALLLANQSTVDAHRLSPLARIVSWASAAQAPEWFTTAPVQASKKALSKAGLSAADIGLWEINEAFSCVTMSCAQLLGIDLERVNVHGGAVALGHPIGASGARILTTLLHAMVARGEKHGLATLCIGGGEAVAMVVELTRD